MRKLLLLGVVLASLALAACGGGGGSTPLPVVSPSTQPSLPPTQYSAKIVFAGTLVGMQSDLRRVQGLSPMSAGTPVPIMVVTAPESGINSTFFGGQVEAVVSPQPSATPTVAFAQNNPDAVLSTPAPTSSPQPLPSGVLAVAIVNGANVVQSQKSGTASATIGAPVNQTPTAPVYSYMSIALDCYAGPGGVLGNTGYAAHFGWKWTGTTWIPDDNATDADVYIDGPSCVVANGAESALTVHIPGGDVRLTTDSAFSSVSSTQWTSTETSFTMQQAIQQNADGSDNGFVIGKTRDGAHVFKLFPNALNVGEGYFGAIEVAGSSVDGF